MDTIDLLFADNNEVIVDALVSKIREQGEDLEDLQSTVDKLSRSVREVEAINEKLKADLAAAKKAAKVTKASKVAAPAKRGRGRPKKAVK